MIESRQAQLVMSVLAGDLVGRVAKRLSGLGIATMPLKGALLQALVYEDARERPLTDVDLLVDDARFSRAVEALLGAGFRERFWGPGRLSVVLRVEDVGMDVDLHAALFGPGLFRMPTREVLARARPDSTLFGASVLIPDPHDLYAHLVGHFVKGRLGPDARVHLRDLARTAERFDLRPASVADHLDACGLGRAARYTLTLAHEVTGDAFAREVLGRLRSDPTGDYLARAARSRLAARGKSAALWTHALNTSLPRGAASLTLQAADVLRRHVTPPPP